MACNLLIQQIITALLSPINIRVSKNLLAKFGTGSFIDYRSKRKIMIVTYLIRGLFIALFSFASNIIFIYGVLVILSIAKAFFNPSATTYITMVVPKPIRKRFNSIRSFASSGAFIIGPAIGGALIYLSSVEMTLWINSFFFFVSAFFLLPLEKGDKKIEQIPKLTLKQVRKDFTVVFRFMSEHKYITGGAIVSGSFQKFDQGYLQKALKQIGANFCGVTQLPYTATDDEIKKLDKNGVKGLRFNIKRGGSEDLSKLDYFARRVHDLVGWHSELYIDAKELNELSATIEKLPAISIDHLGLSEEGLPHLLRLVDKGVRVKATGFGRVHLNVVNALKSIYDINSDALMFGTDLPSTRAKRPFNYLDIELIKQQFDDRAIEKIMYKNAFHWYFKK